MKRSPASLTYLCVLLALAASPGMLGAQSPVVFRARLVHVDGAPTGGIRVGFGTYGSTVTRGNGELETALPAGVAEVKLELVDHDWTVLYPRDGRVPVPRDPTVVQELIIGESVETAALRVFADRHDRLEARLRAVGAEQGEIRGILDAFVDDVTARLAVDSAEFDRALERQRGRERSYPALSATIRNYILRAKDLNETFRRSSRAAVTHRDAYLALVAALEQYNGAFQALHNEQLAFEYQVGTFWESGELKSDLRALYDYALGDVHRVRILPLNERLAVIEAAARGAERDRSRVEAAQAEIDRTVRELDLHLPELERRAERVLAHLARG